MALSQHQRPFPMSDDFVAAARSLGDAPAIEALRCS